MDYRHLALVVPDLREAERFYRETFDMTVLGRETWGEDGETYALRPDKGWDDAEGAGVVIGFVALQRDEVTLALMAGDAAPGQVLAIGLVMDSGEIAHVRSRLAVMLIADRADYLEFFDPFGVRWQLSTDRDFKHAGQIADRWIEL